VLLSSVLLSSLTASDAAALASVLASFPQPVIVNAAAAAKKTITVPCVNFILIIITIPLSSFFSSYLNKKPEADNLLSLLRKSITP
jgi:hypothetical protein